jgi:GntR family transcriptional regulator, transcriptional repressor for pyruvate dehydrogenase complex
VTLPSIDTANLTAIDAVFERLVIDIVQGTHPQGSRLPAERELARRLGASRPTLREALRRLGAWNLVEPRRGSGVVVKSYRDWSIEVVPAYIRHGKPGVGQPTISRILLDILELRRALLLDVLGQAAARVEAPAVEAARAVVGRAWAAREDAVAYAREDLEVMRMLVEGAGVTPGLWALNRIATIWIDLVEALKALMRVPDDYVESYGRFFDLIIAGNPAGALDEMRAYLLRHDEALLATTGLITSARQDRPES